MNYAPFTVFARKEPTTDSTAKAMCPAAQLRTLRDVQIYATPDAKGPMARWSWHYSSKPTRRNKRVAINCFTRPLVWLPDALNS